MDTEVFGDERRCEDGKGIETRKLTETRHKEKKSKRTVEYY